MNPIPDAITALQGYIDGMSGGWTNQDSAIVSAMNAPSAANPTPQGTIPTPYTITQLVGSLSSGSLANLDTFPALYQLMQDIDANNTGNVLIAVEFLAAAGKILSSEATAIEAIVEATELDPSWPSQIGWAQANLGRPADSADIEAARNAPGGQPV